MKRNGDVSPHQISYWLANCVPRGTERGFVSSGVFISPTRGLGEPRFAAWWNQGG
jgi:hypothetical protein